MGVVAPGEKKNSSPDVYTKQSLTAAPKFFPTSRTDNFKINFVLKEKGGGG